MASASSAKSPETLFSSLHASGLPSTPDAHAFVSEVFSRVPRKRKQKSSSFATEASRRQAEKEAKELKSQKFSFVLDDDDSTGIQEGKVSKGKEKEKDRSKKERRTRKRDADGRDWESDEEEKATKRRRAEEPSRHSPFPDDPSSSRGPRGSGSHSGDEGDGTMETIEDEDAVRERDRKERDAFAERIRNKDASKTKKIVEDRSSRHLKGAAAEAAEMRRLADDAVARGAALPSIREHSRQAYLTKREIQQIALLRKEIADDEELFRGMKISKREQRDLEYKKQVLKVAEDRMKIGDKYDGYQLPEDYITEQGKIDKKKKQQVMYARYEENQDQKNFVTDVDQWEESQTRNSTFKSGAQDKPDLVEDYEYVFDESQTIQFVMDQTLGGTLPSISAKDALLRQQIAEAEARGEVYPRVACITLQTDRRSLSF
jgi:pre-mRNA-splicing factor ATP-dependent RNA helicase DHX16